MRVQRGIALVIVWVGMHCWAGTTRAQDNYEIQVYGADTVEKGKTMVELHSNFTFQDRITGSVHLAHSTGSEQAENFIGIKSCSRS